MHACMYLCMYMYICMCVYVCVYVCVDISPESPSSSCAFTNEIVNAATHRNTPQHTAPHCNTLQHIATHCNTLQHTATHCDLRHHHPSAPSATNHSTCHHDTLGGQHSHPALRSILPTCVHSSPTTISRAQALKGPQPNVTNSLKSQLSVVSYSKLSRELTFEEFYVSP